MITKGNWAIHGFLGWSRRVKPAVPIGIAGPIFFRRNYTLRSDDLDRHFWIKGVTQFGKSSYLNLFCTGLYQAGRPFALIDPHGDLAEDVLWSLADVGHFQTPDAFEKVLYIDFSNENYSLPWNIIDSAESTYKKAYNVKEAFKRMFPDLLASAPNFENIILNAVIILIENNLPLTKLSRVLTSDTYRRTLLKNVTYPDVADFFEYRYEKWGREAPKLRESTLNKLTILTLSPTFRYSFGQIENSLNFRKIIDEGTIAIFNLKNLPDDIQKFIGCLLMVGFEQASLSRSNIRKDKRRWYTLVVDECHKFMAKSQESFSNILPQTLKYHFNIVFAHQYLQQLNGLEAALGMAAKIFFRAANPPDAEYSAKTFGMYDPFEIHREAKTETQQDKDFTPIEAYAKGANKLQELHRRNAIIRIEQWNEEIKTKRLPPHRISLEELDAIIAQYAQLLLTPIADLVPATQPPTEKPRYRDILGGRKSRRPAPALSVE